MYMTKNFIVIIKVIQYCPPKHSLEKVSIGKSVEDTKEPTNEAIS